MRNPLGFLKEDEIKTFPIVKLEALRVPILYKEVNVKRDTYTANVKFENLVVYKINLSSDEFALLHYFSEREKVENQFTVQVRARIVETQWPEKDGFKARSTYELQVYVDEDLGYRFNVTETPFVTNFLKALKKGKLKGFEPIVRIPGQNEKEEKIVAASDLQEVPGEELPPEEKEEKLPF